MELSASGNPFTSAPGYGEARGLIDLHMHMMAFEFLGGNVHCGRPWHEYGAPYALPDCIDHTAGLWRGAGERALRRPGALSRHKRLAGVQGLAALPTR